MALIPSTISESEPPVMFRNATELPMLTAARIIQARKENAEPALIKFFHNNATAGGPVGRSLNGGRLPLRCLLEACQLPARMAAIFSAIRLEASTEASSKATSEHATHQ